MVKSEKGKQADLSKYIEGWEPYSTVKGELGFVLPYYKQDGIKTELEWSEYFRGSEIEKDIPAVLVGKFRKQGTAPWEIAGQPVLGPDPSLLDDLIAFIKRHVWIREDGYYTVLASWTINTWLHDFMETSPRLIFHATTRSGKTRALSTLRELSYHGMSLDSPTQATMFRLIEAFHPSLFIDEYQDLHQEAMPLIGSIFKSGFQKGGAVPRCDDDHEHTVRFFSVYSPIAIGLKNRSLMEDMLNRSITVTMLEKPSNADIERMIQKETARALRGRLLALRFKVNSGMITLEPLKQEASKLAEREIPGKEKPIKLDDRSIETAAALLLPSLIIGGANKDSKVSAILGVVASSQAFSDDGLKDSDEGKAFFAIQGVYQCQDELEQTGMDGKKLRNISKMTTRAVSEQYNLDLSEQGDDDNRQQVKTGRVTGMIKSLGFKLRRGSHSQSFFDPDTFQSVYEVNIRKYGGRVN